MCATQHCHSKITTRPLVSFVVTLRSIMYDFPLQKLFFEQLYVHLKDPKSGLVGATCSDPFHTTNRTKHAELSKEIVFHIFPNRLFSYFFHLGSHVANTNIWNSESSIKPSHADALVFGKRLPTLYWELQLRCLDHPTFPHFDFPMAHLCQVLWMRAVSHEIHRTSHPPCLTHGSTELPDSQPLLQTRRHT